MSYFRVPFCYYFIKWHPEAWGMSMFVHSGRLFATTLLSGTGKCCKSHIGGTREADIATYFVGGIRRPVWLLKL